MNPFRIVLIPFFFFMFSTLTFATEFPVVTTAGGTDVATLRHAITRANASVNDDIITLPAGADVSDSPVT